MFGHSHYRRVEKLARHVVAFCAYYVTYFYYIVLDPPIPAQRDVVVSSYNFEITNLLSDLSDVIFESSLFCHEVDASHHFMVSLKSLILAQSER